MRTTIVKRGIFAVAVLAAAIFAVGVTTREADAATPFVNAGGPYSSVVGGTIHFRGSTTVGPLTSAVWTFGDGTSAQGMAVNKQYATSGVFTVTLTVTTIFGQTFSDVTTATVAPFVVPVSPNGQVIQVNATSINIRGLAAAPSPITTYPVTPNGCAYGVVLVNGAYVCANSTITMQTLFHTNPACYYLWLQLGYRPACAFGY